MSDVEDTAAVPAQATAPSPAVLAAVSLKLPPYYPADPEIWFAQIEAQFLTRGVTSEATKFAYVVSGLQPQFAQEIRDILISPPKDHPYVVLRTELIKRTSASEQERLQRLLTQEELGDRKPSQFLRRMEQLLGGKKLPDSIFKQLFLQRMPHHVQSILASSRDTMSLAQLADIADKICEVGSPSPAVASVTAPSTPPLGPQQASSSYPSRCSTLRYRSSR